MAKRRIWQHPLFWLSLMVVGFFAISLYSGIVAYDNFHTHNSGDAGLVTQAVSSATFGRQAPFYESYDCLVKHRCSFLLVHPSFVLYAAAPFYALAPSTVTLFALRSFLVASAAVPLYWLTRQATRSQAKGLLAAGLFLVWAPTLAGDAFSLHLESLLPVELIGLAALWQSGRYRWGMLAALVAFLTFEVAPVFVFLIGLFFTVPYIERWFRGVGRWIRGGNEPRPRFSTQIASGWRAFRNSLRAGEPRYLLLLMASSAAAYVVLYSFMNVWGAQVLGVTSPSVPPGLAGLFYDPSTPRTQSLITILHSSQTLTTGEYWFILYGLLGFLPLLSPRALVISVPWIGWTFLTDSSRFTTLGTQYTLVAAVPLFIGLAYGLRRVPFASPGPPATMAKDAASPSLAASGSGARRRRWRSRAVSYGVVAVLVVVVGANVLFSPIDPALIDLGFHPKAPFLPGYFDNPLTITPGLIWAEQLIANVPRGASIAAPAELFPLLANYPKAMVMVAGAIPFVDPATLARLPFNLSAGPQFLFFELKQAPALAKDLVQNLSNPRLFGLRGYVGSTALGPLLLYEQHYSSRAAQYGPSTFAELNASYAPIDGLEVGPIGRVVANPSAPDGKVIQSPPKRNVTGEVWTGPDVFLAPGSYGLQLEVSASGSFLRSHPQTPVLDFVAQGFGATLLNETFSASQFTSGQWTNQSMNFTVNAPVPDVNFQGFLLTTNVSLAVAYLTVQPISPLSE